MEYKMVPVVSARDIEDEYNSACEKKEDRIESLTDLFWYGEIANESYKYFYLNYDKFDTGIDGETRNKIRAFVKKFIPEYEYVLVDVSW